MSGSLVDHDRTADPLEIRDPNADQAGADPGRGERAGGDAASQCVDADPIDEGGLLEREPLGRGLAPFGCVAGHVSSFPVGSDADAAVVAVAGSVHGWWGLGVCLAGPHDACGFATKQMGPPARDNSRRRDPATSSDAS